MTPSHNGSAHVDSRIERHANKILLGIVAAAALALVNRLDKVIELANSNERRIAVIEKRLDYLERE